MSDLVVVEPTRPLPSAERVTLGAATPSIEELFLFAREAELRVRSLRMIVEARSLTARGEAVVRHEVLLRHPGLARVTSRRGEDPLSRDYDVWIGDGDTVRTFSARDRLASVRSRQPGLVGSEDADLPLWARHRPVLTPLPGSSLADTFVHPHGFFRNVLVSGQLALIGLQLVRGREAFVVRAEHPRVAKVLADRPDRVVDVGIDRLTGFLVLLSERIAGVLTQHAEVTALEPDADIPDAAFELHLGSGVRMLY